MNYKVDGYELTTLSDEINVQHLISVHYFEYSKNYIFEGEKHDFWEFLYVDKGEINVMADDRKYILKRGEMIFHKPNEWHNVIANGKVAPNLVVIAFDCQNEAMEYFYNKVVSVDTRIKSYLANIISAAKDAFKSDLSDPQLKSLKRRKKSKFASEQLIRMNLELLLIEMIRGEEEYSTVTRTSPNIREYAQEEKVGVIINILKENIHESLSLNDVCRQTLLSKSSLQKIFKESMQVSVMEYFKQLKIEEAKTLIREGNHNFTEISNILGYNSIHYFSRIFKNVTGMTLSEYANSVKLHIK
ncbi:AraC family transcriptional regulator [Oceanirhabdus sp. W0125-5]|uniref:AraC family transcriptional regulator n=1 Tax=Oceanirhabdus sp. W0125-5 TaxID=2999116 RepID=UPI0022F329CF|nr:AraC family transcriptional regulator [Oceanirhabdus sp. W0125-5]WBW98896.1 AraC family transcriptional regulator [Oceanirhabdus sp. W0125-5]